MSRPSLQLEFEEIARAKVNLTLRVLGKRDDAYHQIESIVAFANVGDRLVMRPRAGTGERRPASLNVSGTFAGSIAGQNLVTTALRLVEATSNRPVDADFELEKLLPVASGIGGGSADAAALLRLVRDSDPQLRDLVDWAGIARRLGADVPVCLAAHPAFVSGTGETVEPLALPALDIVLANACEPVPPDKTRRVFAALAAPPLSGPTTGTVLPDALEWAQLIELIRAVGNDLEAPARAVLPAIGRVKAAIAATAGCEIAILSGAGPTVVGVYPSAEAAQVAVRQLSAAHPSWWVTASRTLST